MESPTLLAHARVYTQYTHTHTHTHWPQVSQANSQRQFVEGIMVPIIAGIQDALTALKGALDARVFVATGRALWDYVGKDLYEFVESLTVSQGVGECAQREQCWCQLAKQPVMQSPTPFTHTHTHTHPGERGGGHHEAPTPSHHVDPTGEQG